MTDAVQTVSNVIPLTRSDKKLLAENIDRVGGIQRNGHQPIINVVGTIASALREADCPMAIVQDMHELQADIAKLRAIAFPLPSVPQSSHRPARAALHR